MSATPHDAEKKSAVIIRTRARPSTDSLRAPALLTPRTARFAEATSVVSPIDPPDTSRHYMAQPQPADVGFGYIGAHAHHSVEMPNTHAPPLGSAPLKSAMKTPGQAPRDLHAVLSPTFQNEDLLEKQEAQTDRQQARDLRVKTRIRLAKVLLRGINFSCALIVLALLTTTFMIFNATKALAPRNSLPPWAPNQKIWPQVVLLVIAAISLVASVIILYAYYKGGHRRAERVAVYYTVFACGFFIVAIVMWCVAAGILQGSRDSSNGKDLWGWSCKDNTRRELFENDVAYDLVCRLQNWSLVCCIIEVVVEMCVIAIYAVVFYRFYSKRKLRQSMAARDRARSDLYLAQLRSGPNTPAPFSPGPRTPGLRTPGLRTPGLHTSGLPAADPASDTPSSATSSTTSKPFRLRPPPIKIHLAEPPAALQSPGLQSPAQTQQDPFAPAPGEQLYQPVAIPEAYVAEEGPIRAAASPR